MSSETNNRDRQEQADLDKAWRHFVEGTPFEPDLGQRLRARSEKITQKIFQKFGYIDIDKLLHDDET